MTSVIGISIVIVMFSFVFTCVICGLIKTVARRERERKIRNILRRQEDERISRVIRETMWR